MLLRKKALAVVWVDEMEGWERGGNGKNQAGVKTCKSSRIEGTRDGIGKRLKIQNHQDLVTKC